MKIEEVKRAIELIEGPFVDIAIHFSGLTRHGSISHFTSRNMFDKDSLIAALVGEGEEEKDKHIKPGELVCFFYANPGEKVITLPKPRSEE